MVNDQSPLMHCLFNVSLLGGETIIRASTFLELMLRLRQMCGKDLQITEDDDGLGNWLVVSASTLIELSPWAQFICILCNLHGPDWSDCNHYFHRFYRMKMDYQIFPIYVYYIYVCISYFRKGSQDFSEIETVL